MADRWWRRRRTSDASKWNPVVGYPTGVLGHDWRALVTPSGDVVDADGTALLRWFVAADDRWHRPADEVAVRQSNVAGSAVVETRLRVPGGDVVQTIWSAIASNGRGYTVVEFANESSMPVAIAIAGDDVLTPRPVAPGEAPGLEPDEPVRVLPVAHRTNISVLIAHDVRGAEWPSSWPTADEVAAGWLAIATRGGRVSVPEVIDGRPVDEIVMAARCRAALEDPELIDDPIERLLSIDERRRMNLHDDDLEPMVVASVEQVIAGLRKGSGDESATRLALTSANRLLQSDARAAADLVAAVARLKNDRAATFPEAWGEVQAPGPLVDSGRRLSADLIDRVVRWTAPNTVTLMPDGLPRRWWGNSCEVFDVPAGPDHRISFAIRWHGERPAVLWEVVGPPGLALRSGADEKWATIDASGEALWAAPSPVRISMSVSSDQSFR